MLSCFRREPPDRVPEAKTLGRRLTCLILSMEGACAKTAHEHVMKLAEEFRQNAEEWRQLEGLAATDVHRRRIAEVANTWLAWAERRERIATAEEPAKPDER